MLNRVFYWPPSKCKPIRLPSLPLPFAQEKAHPLATLHFLSLDVLTPLYLSFIKTFQAPKSFATFPDNPLLDPWFCTSSFKTTTITLSFTVRSRLNAAWLCHCQLFAKLPGWCEAAARASPGACVLLAQVKAEPGLRLSLKRTKGNNNIKLKSKTQAKERTKMEFQNLFFFSYLSLQMWARLLNFTARYAAPTCCCGRFGAPSIRNCIFTQRFLLEYKRE